VIRDPAAVLASRKRMEENATGRFSNIRGVLRDLELSCRVDAEEAGARRSDGYLVLRYEEVVADPARVAGMLANFLGVEPAVQLLEPSVGGRPATANTSFPHEAAAPPLSDAERLRLHAVVGDAARAVGYDVTVARLS
jgi:hypothetical protein